MIKTLAESFKKNKMCIKFFGKNYFCQYTKKVIKTSKQNTMQKIATLLFLAFLISLMACKKDSSTALKELNLLEYGFPLTVMVPEGSKVTVSDRTYFKDVTIKGEDNYGINIITYQAFTTSASQLKTEELNDVKNGMYFSELIKQEEDGFIYKTVVDTTNISYDFRYFIIKGDREYRFQATTGTYTQEEAERMYNAIKPRK